MAPCPQIGWQMNVRPAPSVAHWPVSPPPKGGPLQAEMIPYTMRQTDAVPGWEVLYASDTDSFRTVQTHTPVPGRHYTPIEVTAVVLEGVGGWTVDVSDPAVPKATKKGARSWPLNQAIRDGLIKVLPPINRTVPLQDVG